MEHLEGGQFPSQQVICSQWGARHLHDRHRRPLSTSYGLFGYIYHMQWAIKPENDSHQSPGGGMSWQRWACQGGTSVSPSLTRLVGLWSTYIMLLSLMSYRNWRLSTASKGNHYYLPAPVWHQPGSWKVLMLLIAWSWFNMLLVLHTPKMRTIWLVIIGKFYRNWGKIRSV